MDYEAGGPLLQVLLLIGGKSSHLGAPKELLQFPDGRLAIEHALETLYNAVPSASTIYISLQDESQLEGIKPPLKYIITRAKAADNADHNEHDQDHHQGAIPSLKLILDQREEDTGPAAGLLAAHAMHPDAKWLVLACNYPLLPPSALQQLILEYRNSVTCFVNEGGFVEPLIAIWDSEALEKLNEIMDGRYELIGVVEEMKGTLVTPLREQWITRADTREKWDDAMAALTLRGKREVRQAFV